MYEVNRSLFLLIPREPFWHWLHSIGTDLSDFTLEDLQDDANAYLTDPCDNTDEIWDSIEGRVEDIFAPNWPTGAKTTACGPTSTPTSSPNGSTSAPPQSLPTSPPNRSHAKPSKRWI